MFFTNKFYSPTTDLPEVLPYILGFATYDLPESSSRVFLEKPDHNRSVGNAVNCSGNGHLRPFWLFPHECSKNVDTSILKKRSSGRVGIYMGICILGPPRIYPSVCRIGFRVSKRRVCTIGLICWKHTRPNLSPTGKLKFLMSSRGEKRRSQFCNNQYYTTAFGLGPREGCASRSLPRIKFKRGFAQPNFSIHVFLQAAYRAESCKEATNKTKQDKTKQTNQPTTGKTPSKRQKHKVEWPFGLS